ncbi:unnamed protein product [Mortierella alpina]
MEIRAFTQNELSSHCTSRLGVPLPMLTLANLRSTLTAARLPCRHHSSRRCSLPAVLAVLAAKSPSLWATRATHSSPSDLPRVASTARPPRTTVAPAARAKSPQTHERAPLHQSTDKGGPGQRSKQNHMGASDHEGHSRHDPKEHTAAPLRRKAPSKGPPKRMPDHFRPIPDTERIEGLDKVAVNVLFTQRTGSSSLSNEAFSIKASRMPFTKPLQPNIPVFVQKAQAEYDQALERYHHQQKDLQSIPTEKDLTSNPPSALAPSPTTTKLLPMPEPSPLIRQYHLRSQRLYPSSISDPHPAFRVTFILSKKLISKLAVHRNFARKKLAAAAETVFRDHARPGYEYIIFAKRECVTTLQDRLVELMKSDLSNPKLYGERDAAVARGKGKDRWATNKDKQDQKAIAVTPHASTDTDRMDHEDEPLMDSMLASPAIKTRWKNNSPPISQKWWKHALPNPLGRTQQSGAYLNMHCPEAQEALAPLRLAQGLLKKKDYLRKRNAEKTIKE